MDCNCIFHWRLVCMCSTRLVFKHKIISIHNIWFIRYVVGDMRVRFTTVSIFNEITLLLFVCIAATPSSHLSRVSQRINPIGMRLLKRHRNELKRKMINCRQQHQRWTKGSCSNRYCRANNNIINNSMQQHHQQQQHHRQQQQQHHHHQTTTTTTTSSTATSTIT